MNYIKDIPLYNGNSYKMIIEIIKGSKNKKELLEPFFDKLETVRKIKLKYPFYYGCFTQTLAGDGDALDAVLLTNKKHNELDVIEVTPVCVLKTLDDEEQDDKVFVIDKTEDIKNLDKLIKQALKFLYNYKGKKSNTIIDDTLYNNIEAAKIIKEAHNFYNKQNKNNKQQAVIKIKF